MFDEHAAQFSGLVEDNRTSTRIYALRCIAAFPPINAKYFQSLAYGKLPMCFSVSTHQVFAIGVLQRLDDPSADVREWSARVVPKIEINEESINSAVWISFLTNALFLHLDGPEIKLTNVLKGKMGHTQETFIIPELF